MKFQITQTTKDIWKALIIKKNKATFNIWCRKCGITINWVLPKEKYNNLKELCIWFRIYKWFQKDKI